MRLRCGSEVMAMLKYCLIIASVSILAIAISKKFFADAVRTKQMWDVLLRMIKKGGE